MNNSQKIEKCHKMMFKMLVNAYARSRFQNQLIEDCYSATSLQIETMAERVHHELQIIQEIVDATPVPNEMSVIAEESTDRQDNEFGRQTERVKELFNTKLFTFKKIQNSLDQMLTLYKSQLKCMAQEVTEFKSKNKKLKAALDLQKKRNQEFQNQLSDLEISHARKPPIPFQQESFRQPEVCIQCQNKENKQISANIDDKGKWKTLSNKIDKLRKKIENTQQQLQNKDKEIYALTSRLAKTKDHEPELKKSKQLSTTLRGEKITLQTKLSNLKKEFADKEEAIELQIKENRKLRIQIDNINSTNRWQNNVINDLKQTISKIRVGKEMNSTAQVEQTQRLQRQKSALIQFVHQQEDLLVKMNQKLKELQHQTQSELLQSKQQLQQLQDILDEKNDTIIKLKSKGTFNGKGEDHQKMPYYQELIRVLTRKVADRDHVINQLKNHH